jgi:hypothetical protein
MAETICHSLDIVLAHGKIGDGVEAFVVAGRFSVELRVSLNLCKRFPAQLGERNDEAEAGEADQ